MENCTAKLKKYWLWGFLVLAISLIFVPWIKFIDFGKETSVIANYENLAQYISGITAPLLSLITVVLVWKTYQSQKEELSETTNALQEQKTELEAQKTELKAQTAIAQKQYFHDVFAVYLRLFENQYAEIKNSYGGTTDDKPLAIRNLFKNFYNNVVYEVKVNDKVHETIKNKTSNFLKEDNKNSILFKRYINSLNDLIQVIENSTIDVSEKNIAIKRIRNRIVTEDELRGIFFYGLSNEGQDFKELIDKYEILEELKRLPTDNLINILSLQYNSLQELWPNTGSNTK